MFMGEMSIGFLKYVAAGRRK